MFPSTYTQTIRSWRYSFYWKSNKKFTSDFFVSPNRTNNQNALRLKREERDELETTENSKFINLCPLSPSLFAFCFTHSENFCRYVKINIFKKVNKFIIGLIWAREFILNHARIHFCLWRLLLLFLTHTRTQAHKRCELLEKYVLRQIELLRRLT